MMVVKHVGTSHKMITNACPSTILVVKEIRIAMYR